MEKTKDNISKKVVRYYQKNKIISAKSKSDKCINPLPSEKEICAQGLSQNLFFFSLGNSVLLKVFIFIIKNT